jgi:SagB-type dehydrogenase family enzyme
MVIVPFGAPRDEAPGAVTGAAATEPAFVAVDRSAAAPGVPDAVRLVAGRTALALTGERAAPFAPAPSLPPRPPVDGDPIPLPAAATTGDALGPVIERRRSARRFGTEPLALPALAAVLDRARGGGLARQRAVRIHVIANHVAGLAPGVYELRSAERALSPVRRGDVREAAYEMALSQEVVERAAAIVVLTADVATMSWPDGSRGLRTAWIDAGVAAGRMYLQAVALGLGVSSVGAFFDDEVVDLLDLDGAVELPVLLVALGTRA